MFGGTVSGFRLQIAFLEQNAKHMGKGCLGSANLQYREECCRELDRQSNDSTSQVGLHRRFGKEEPIRMESRNIKV